MQPQAFYRVVTDDFTAVDGIIRRQLTSRVPLVEKIGDYITSAGGKRLRPLLVLLAGNALGVHGERLNLLAATIEFLHTATLLHDDVVDKSGMRRGRSTANALWGNAPSVLVGDFLYARSFEMLVELGELPVMQVLANATRVIAEGEVLQLSKIRDAGTTEEIYMEVIRGKTAMLFEASAHSAALLAGASAEQVAALRTFGDALGVAFQLVDDLLDYTAREDDLGKPVLSDLKEGKLTLPLLRALPRLTAAERAAVAAVLEDRGFARTSAPEILELVRREGTLEEVAELARRRADDALRELERFPDGDARRALELAPDFVLRRRA